MTHTGAFNYKAKKTTPQLLSCGLILLYLNTLLIIYGRLQQLIEFFGQVTKEDLEWRFPSQTFPGTPI